MSTLDLTATTCAADGCTSARYCRGYCTRHYQRLLKHGNLDFPQRRKTTLAERLTRYVVTEGGCWQWSGPVNLAGYGVLWLGHERYLMAHRASFVHHRGPVPDGLQLDHLCRNRACINPDHLDPVTNRVNVLRGEGPTAENARKSGCVHGHAFTPANTYWHNGKRYCRTCRRERQRIAYAAAIAREWSPA